MKTGLKTAFIVSLCLVSFRPLPAQGTSGGGGMFAVSDGRGRVDLVWFPPLDRWPAGGWQLSDQTGKVLQAKIAAGEGEAMKSLSPEDQKSIVDFPAALAKAARPEDRGRIYVVAGLRAFTDEAYARALGLRWTLEGVKAGALSYQVIGLEASGRPAGPALRSRAVDGAVASPSPPPPTNLKAEAREEGVALFWKFAVQSKDLPIYSYRVERLDSAGARKELTARPLVVSLGLDEKTPRFVDTAPAVEQEVTYLVRSADLFGRLSDPQKVTVFSPDLKALVPPPGLAAGADKGRISLKWNSPLSPRTARIIVERSNRRDGVYQTLTPEGVKAGENRFLDEKVVGGLTYYYRLRSVGPRGDLGRPGESVSVQAISSARPGVVRGLKAELGTTRIRLTWEPVRQDLAGYLVERRVGQADFERLNESLVQESRYDDPLKTDVSGELFYRVRAVTFENLTGDASSPVKVSIPDLSPPPSPTIASSRVEGGKVILHIVASAPVEKTSQFLVLRSGSEKEEGLVLGRPVAAATGDWSDAFVEQGAMYWYRAVALDRQGRRSEPSRAVSVFVPVSDLPTPASPVVMFQKKPFLGVKVSFVKPPSGLLVAVERKTGGQNVWSLILESQSGTEAWDTNPPKEGEVYYRIVYHTAAGARSQPSPPAALKR